MKLLSLTFPYQNGDFALAAFINACPCDSIVDFDTVKIAFSHGEIKITAEIMPKNYICGKRESLKF
ncbi:MAG: hypothetical protein RRZ64_08080 [Rikenellaceae bacterium]